MVDSDAVVGIHLGYIVENEEPVVIDIPIVAAEMETVDGMVVFELFSYLSTLFNGEVIEGEIQMQHPTVIA